MSILLPSTPGPAETVPSYIDFGGILRPFLGGADQKLNRLGNRFALDVTMPPMEIGDARIWVARLIRAQSDGAIFPWPLSGFLPGAPGAPVVNGAGQSGTSLAVRGATSGYGAKEGQFFSIINGGRRYLHLVATDITLGGGSGTLTIAPMLRVKPGDGAPLEMATPLIEGFLEGNSRDWTISMAQHVGLQFRIVEAE